MIAWLMGPRAVPRRRSRPPNRLRLALSLLLAIAVGALAFLVVTQPGRIGIFPEAPVARRRPGSCVDAAGAFADRADGGGGRGA